MSLPPFEIIPAIDLLGGQCVRLVQGDYAQSTVYGEDPVGMAKHWETQGAKRLHIVDLDGAKAGHPVNTAVIVNMIRAVQIPVQVGGGIRSVRDAQALLACGVNRIILGSVVFTHFDILPALLALVDPSAIIVGMDLKNGKPAIQGWTESIDTELGDILKKLEKEGVQRLIATDISKDGMLAGPNLELMRTMTTHTSMAVIASGGVTRTEDIAQLAEIPGIEGCIIGKALYEGKLRLT